MGKVTRKRYVSEFKSRVASEAIRGKLMLARLASKHGVHQTISAQWKRQAIEGMAATFSGKTVYEPPVSFTAAPQPVGRVLSACATERGQSGVEAVDRRPVPGNAVLWLLTDDMASAPSRT